MKGIFKRAKLLVCAAALAICLGGCSHKEVSWEKNITEETMYVEGLEGEYTFLFLTDVHAVIQDEEAAEQEQQYAAERSGMFHNDEGVSSVQQFPAWIEYANEMEVDAVLLGGDIIDSPSDANIEWLEEQLEQLEMPYLYVLGNHDWTYPWEYMSDYGRENYLPKLAPMMQGHSQLQWLEVGELLLVGVDNSTNQVNPNALSGYEKLLKLDRPVIVLNHLPYASQTLMPKAVAAWNSPTVIGNEDEGGIRPDEASSRFLELTLAEESPVVLVLAGHAHLYDDNVINEERQLRQIVGDAAYKGNAVLLHVTGQ